MAVKKKVEVLNLLADLVLLALFISQDAMFFLLLSLILSSSLVSVLMTDSPMG